jgi:hypothetical protein
MGLTLDKEESTCLKRGLWQNEVCCHKKITIDQMEKESGELP